ncbi:hypothetical protein Nepgr_006475 [Nepenthes gracilis]|uniref:Uncharacterized protein n=1 Tax=Nepenthes gracilis TaxID=150966 RepID=A0AAD3XHG2_NEPGR|nr:hypothetical protein Nepgr_006475 [Nepenthes gracilis]
MEPIASVFDRLKAFTKSGEDFVVGLIRRCENSARRNPIEILKRLQRESFADLMKLRERQEKVEKLLTFYKASKGGPFQEGSTHVRGEVHLLETLLFRKVLDQQNLDTINRGGIRPGIVLRLIFEATVRQKDSIEAEFISSQSSHGYSGGILQIPLSLAKLCYTANLTDWLSMVIVPLGAHCRDVAISTSSSSQEKGLNSCGPPILHQHSGSAIGIMVRKSNVVASLAQCFAEHPSSVGLRQCFTTFGQIVCQLPRSTKLSLFGLRQMPMSNQLLSLGNLTLPPCIFNLGKPSYPSIKLSDPPLETNSEDRSSTRSVALMLESELDESTNIRGWIQLKNSNSRYVQWAITMTDSPEEEMGWGLSLGGMVQDPVGHDHFHVEAFLRFNLGKRIAMQPGLVYLMDGSNRMRALVFRSTWSL